MNRIAIAQAFVQEQIQRRPDLIAAMSTVAEIAQANEDEAIRTRGLTLVQEWLQ